MHKSVAHTTHDWTVSKDVTHCEADTWAERHGGPGARRNFPKGPRMRPGTRRSYRLPV